MTGNETSKERTLELLEYSRGSFVSGEQIAGRLQISRNSVWKAVRALRKDGYHITAVTNKGYCLTEENDILSVQGIRPYLRLPADQYHLMVYGELSSTNLTAKELALQGAPHGTVVIADRQTAGAGRASASFFSPKGGLYMSIILRPAGMAYPEGNQRNNTAAGSESGGKIQDYAEKAAPLVAEAVQEVCGVSPEIRGTGDLFLNGKKICGILTESGGEIETGMIHYLVLGIGIHFSTPAGAFPEELRGSCGSIFEDQSAVDKGHADATRNYLAAAIINRILC